MQEENEQHMNLIKAFRRKHHKIILARPSIKNHKKNSVMIRLWGEEFKDDPKGKLLVTELRKIKFDKIIDKSEYSAFYNTDLQIYCNKNRIDELFLTGTFSGACVYFTGVDAAYRHIQPYYVNDAVGSPKKSLVGIKWKGDTIKKFKLMIGPLVNTKDVLKNL